MISQAEVLNLTAFRTSNAYANDHNPPCHVVMHRACVRPLFALTKADHLATQAGKPTKAFGERIYSAGVPTGCVPSNGHL